MIIVVGDFFKFISLRIVGKYRFRGVYDVCVCEFYLCFLIKLINSWMIVDWS